MKNKYQYLIIAGLVIMTGFAQRNFNFEHTKHEIYKRVYESYCYGAGAYNAHNVAVNDTLNKLINNKFSTLKFLNK